MGGGNHMAYVVGDSRPPLSHRDDWLGPCCLSRESLIELPFADSSLFSGRGFLKSLRVFLRKLTDEADTFSRLWEPHHAIKSLVRFHTDNEVDWDWYRLMKREPVFIGRERLPVIYSSLGP